jgi:RNA polymerase sigma-70 factor (sigma-E family)
LDTQESFHDYVRARTARLSRVAYLLTGDHHLAEDLVQQTLLRVAERWKRISGSGDPDAYVRRVLYTQHVSWWRRARPGLELRAQPPDRPVPDPAADILTSLMIRRALSRLGKRQRSVLILRYFEDLTEAQTAEVLNCSVGTVKSQARDGLARLRQLAPELAELGSGPVTTEVTS